MCAVDQPYGVASNENVIVLLITASHIKLYTDISVVCTLFSAAARPMLVYVFKGDVMHGVAQTRDAREKPTAMENDS